jgi:putative chitinase
MAQIEHESGLIPCRENMNYSAKVLFKVFKKYFPTLELAQKYANKPQDIANIVYANRMGNDGKFDGWKYRGGGFLQITGRNNYLMMTKDTRIDFLSNPDIILQEANALVSALWFWQKNNLNSFADNNDFEGLTRKINGGLNGLQDRMDLLRKYE